MTIGTHPRAGAVLFDLDGTLINSLADIAASANEVLASLGHPEHPTERYREFIGEGVAVLFRRALPAAHRDDETVARCVEGFRRAYDRGWNVRTRVYDGIPELLDALVERGLALAVLSNKPDTFTKACVDEYGARWSFRAVLGAREGIPNKPDPTSAIEIAGRLGCNPSEVVYVGDSAIDMMTARRAGMRAVGVAWGFRSVDELRDAGAEWIVDRPEQILDILDGKS
jgi:phosphoglycolate phosphatase